MITETLPVENTNTFEAQIKSGHKAAATDFHFQNFREPELMSFFCKTGVNVQKNFVFLCFDLNEGRQNQQHRVKLYCVICKSYHFKYFEPLKRALLVIFYDPLYEKKKA